MKKSFLIILFTSIAGIGGFSACNSPSNERTPQEDETTDSLTNEQLLDSVQYRTFQYFWEGAEPTYGMARERSEEHTTEIQSLMRNSSAVFCLKNKQTNNHN